jgi:hypothetical protein
MVIMQIIRTRTYERKVQKLLNENEALKAENEIAFNPFKWPTIAGTGGIRKARVARDTMGKSGGARILYYYWVTNDDLYLLDIYAKNEQTNISEQSKKTLRTIIRELKGE